MKSISPLVKHIETNSISGRSSVGRNSPCQMLMLGRGCGLKSKLPAARQSAPRFYADTVENHNNPNLTGFQFLTPPGGSPLNNKCMSKKQTGKKQNIETKTKKSQKKKSHLVCNETNAFLLLKKRCHIKKNSPLKPSRHVPPRQKGHREIGKFEDQLV